MIDYLQLLMMPNCHLVFQLNFSTAKSGLKGFVRICSEPVIEISVGDIRNNGRRQHHDRFSYCRVMIYPNEYIIKTCSWLGRSFGRQVGEIGVTALCTKCQNGYFEKYDNYRKGHCFYAASHT
jgi:hypothetical protein